MIDSIFDDKPEIAEECGIFGIHCKGEDVSKLTFFGIFSLQHRGQESAGIAATDDGKTIKLHREMGLVTQIFREEILQELTGHAAIAHTRYSTNGASVARNIQPMVTHTEKFGEIAMAHNGDLVNADEVREVLKKKGAEFESTSDSEVIMKIIECSDADNIIDAITEVVNTIKGGFAVVLLVGDKVYAFRDPMGIRPLSLATMGDDNFVVASETCAFNTIGAKYVREVNPGEILCLDENGARSTRATPKKEEAALCCFEYVYIARPDSNLYDVSVHAARRRMGAELAKEYPVDADIVFPIPHTGTPAAIGLAQESKIPYMEAVIKNYYIHRTFIEPTQQLRELGVRMKLSPLTESLRGKRVIMVDDSIVRGTTIGPTIKMIRDAGAAEVHVRIASPPLPFPCFYGIDTASRKELIAARMSVEEIRQYIGADSLGFLSLEGLLKAIGVGHDKLCCACLDGKYPIEINKEMREKKYLFDEDVKGK
ncbi:MAG: amidophosphoribosyltransferase [Abditibacteriota bacterium]|nr:amidophosphoribosyltransferase [Abditibacteriota bacterium]MBP5093165.1 amidophosphoribosyltransferase [Abditibacteriota bacterium]